MSRMSHFRLSAQGGHYDSILALLGFGASRAPRVRASMPEAPPGGIGRGSGQRHGTGSCRTSRMTPALVRRSDCGAEHQACSALGKGTRGIQNWPGLANEPDAGREPDDDQAPSVHRRQTGRRSDDTAPRLSTANVRPRLCGLSRQPEPLHEHACSENSIAAHKLQLLPEVELSRHSPSAFHLPPKIDPFLI